MLRACLYAVACSSLHAHLFDVLHLVGFVQSQVATALLSRVGLKLGDSYCTGKKSAREIHTCSYTKLHCL